MAGQNRKNQLRALFQTVEPVAERAADTPSQSAEPASHPPAPMPEARARAASGAVKAMGLSLGGLSREIEDARRLKESLSAADRVIEIEPELIDASFVNDRLGHDDSDESFQTLMQSVGTSGQQVPVLVRPHPEKPGRFQTAYGHRRIRAAARLGQRVRAIVRDLSDTDLVLAQGKENNERTDLSFIERAFFAHALIERGFERSVVQEALSLHKAEMTRYLQVAEAVPLRIASAIGPAPKIGRPRWMAVADLLKSEAALSKADDEITTERFRAAASSDLRFNLLFARLQRKAVKVGQAREVHDGEGRAVALVSIAKGKARVEFVDKIADGFEDFLGEELPKLLERFRQGASGPAEQG
ncbi:plasmid partitioning protein RepB [Mesorhizobium sp. Root157]|uniref:plasmid partitioning protein RepB n=1 Tax=Mesorhizobium sp. Root157 TaxID=1736477 RepID=UPI000701F2C6|nr:plasmid partitioning protein RepB [Mesorhizobium sp. Root157]KQZ87945.1 plasmid partitioning protein RepB [Mesorhizobium sp. Root157]